MKCLTDFGDMAGLRANILKSNMFMAGVSDEVKNEILSITRFQEGHFPFRYLGIPIASTKLKNSDYSPLMDTLAKKINAWPKHIFLMQADWS